MNDPVNPAHYTDFGYFSALHAVEEWGLNYHLGQTLKYIQRHEQKDGLTDLRKARWYLQRYINLLAPEEELDPVTDRSKGRYAP